MTSGENFAAQRRAMVDGQIRTFAVTESSVIAAFALVPREVFLPESLQAFAYSDAILALPPGTAGGDKRAMLQPMHLARLIQGARVLPSDRVLVVGGGSGYAGCVMARLAASVVTLDSDPSWTATAEQAFGQIGTANAKAVTGPLPEGWAADAPYDIILVQGAVETGLDTLFSQLAPDGRLVTVETRGRELSRRAGKAVSFRRTVEDISAQPLFDATVPVLPDFRVVPAFSFG